MSNETKDPTALLDRVLETGRVHSAYLLAGPGAGPREAALRFVRGLVCAAESGAKPCEDCIACRRSHCDEPIELGKSTHRRTRRLLALVVGGRAGARVIECGGSL